MRSQNLIMVIIFAAALSSVPLFARSVAAADNLAALSEEQAEFAQRTLDFIAKMDSMHFNRVEKMNGGLELETLNVETEYSSYDAKVARGSVVEKTGRVITISNRPATQFQKQNLWSRFFSLDVHPKTPLVGILHAAFVVQFYPDGTSTIGGTLDVLRSANVEEDLAYLKQVMDDVLEKHGVDSAPYREQICEREQEETNRWRRKSACVGATFYGPNSFTVTAENFNLMTEAYERFVDAYLTVIERRKDDSYTQEDLASQDAMRRNWLEDHLFVDPYTANVTPWEAWSLYSLPPTVKF